MPPGVPVEQWTPEYAAQIAQILERAQAQNPDVPGLGEPGIVPLGAPGDLTPPQVTPKPQEPLPSLSPTPPTPSPEIVQPGGGQAGFLQSLGQGLKNAPWGNIAEALGMGALGFLGGIQPGQLGAQNIQTAAEVGQRVQQQRGIQQAMQIRTQATQILQEKGADAAKKFLSDTVTSQRLSPTSFKAVSDQLKEVSDRIAARDAVAKLGSERDPVKLMNLLPTLFETLGPEKAIDLFKTVRQETKVQFIPAGDSIYAADPVSGKVKPVAGITAQAKMTDFGGDDVAQMLTRMGQNPRNVLEGASRDDPQAMALFQQAAQRVEQQRQDEIARREAAADRRAVTAADIQGKAQIAAATTQARIMAEAQTKMNIPVEMVDKDAIVYDVEGSKRDKPYSVTPMDVASSAGKKQILSGQDYAKVGRIDAVMRSLDALEKAADRVLADKPGQNLYVAMKEKLQPALADEDIARFQALQSTMLSLPGLIQGDNRVSNIDLQATAGFKPDTWDTKATARARIQEARTLLKALRSGWLGQPLPAETPFLTAPKGRTTPGGRRVVE